MKCQESATPGGSWSVTGVFGGEDISGEVLLMATVNTLPREMKFMNPDDSLAENCQNVSFSTTFFLLSNNCRR